MNPADFLHEIGDPWPEAVFLLNKTGRILALNRAAEKALGLDRKQGIGLLLPGFTVDDAESVTSYLRTCLGNRQQMPGSLTFLDSDGQTRRYRCQGYRVHPDPDGPPAVFLRCTPAQGSGDRFNALNRQLEEQRLAHRGLTAAHARLKAVLDSLEAIVYVADMTTYEVLFINRYCRDLIGDITGKTCWQSIQKGQTGPCSFCTNKYLLSADGTPAEVYTWEFQNSRNNRWYYILDRAIHWVDGRLVRLEIATDITETKEAEIHRTLNTERVESLLTLSRNEWKSREALIDYALKEAVRLTNSEVGYLRFIRDELELTGIFSWPKSIFEKCPPAKRQHYSIDKAGIWADSIRLREPVIHNDYPNTPNRKGYPEGHFQVHRHMSIPIFDGDKIIAVAGVGNKEAPYGQEDLQQLRLFMNSTLAILKQKQTDLAVKKAKEQWEETFNATDLAITIHDREMRITRANRAAGKLFATEPEELVGRYCYSIFRDATSPCPGCPELETFNDLQSHQATIRHEKLGKTFEVVTSPLVSDEKNLHGCVHIVKDVTESKILESKLQQAQKMEAVGTLAGGIAHDFNNILTPILGYAELTANMIEPSDPVASHLKAIHSAGLRAKELVQQILTFSRQTTHEKEPLQPYPLIKETLKLLRSSLPTTIEIRENISRECGSILGDPTQMQQIVMNLCTNAYHAMREDGGVLAVVLKQLDISTGNSKVLGMEMEPGPYVVIEVSDTGCGMDTQTMSKIFEPYFTTKNKGEGTGLGLAIIHGIVRSYGGHITVYSEPGKGTTFHVYLPAITAESTEFAGSPTAMTLPTGNERLLVVDDEETITHMLHAVLAELGYQVKVTNRSDVALQLFREHPNDFDLLITDMTMPHLTGLDLIEHVFAIRPDMPVILCTGFSELINREKATALGIHSFLMKPIAIDKLLQAIRKTLAGDE